jgi:hypothetical protein
MAYVTTTSLKSYRSITSTSTADDAVLTVVCAAAQAQVDSYCDRTFEASSTSIRYYDAVQDVDGRTLYLGTDLAELTAIINGDDTALSITTSVITVPANDTPYRALKLRSGSANAWTYNTEPEGAIEVTGYWAYSKSAPNDIVLATLRLANYMYTQKDAGVFDVTVYPSEGAVTVPQGMPRDVQEILRPYRRIR